MSDYYRYNRSLGQLWRTKSATAYAVIENGKIMRFEITDGGSGYSSAPMVSVPGYENVVLSAELGFDKEFERNGRVVEITVVKIDGGAVDRRKVEGIGIDMRGRTVRSVTDFDH